MGGPSARLAGEWPSPSSMMHAARALDLGSLVDQVLLTRHVPASVVVDEALNIVYVRGPTERYLTPASGKASLHLLKMVHPGLLLGLRTAVTLAQQEGRAVTKELIQIG